MNATVLGALFATLITGNVLGITLALFGLIIIQFMVQANFSVTPIGIWNLFNNFTFVAVPLFILLGNVLVETGLAARIYAALAPLFARLPGKLLQTNIGMATVFSAICGSSTATSSVVGAMAYEELVRRGYNRGAVVGSIAGGGTLGILIPPSISLIIYGSWQGVSIGKLFLAGIVPGLVVSVAFMTYIALLSYLRPGTVPRGETVVPLVSALRGSVFAWPFLVLIFAILGTMFLGLATATEAAAGGVGAAILLAMAYRAFSVARLWRAVYSTVQIFGVLALILIGASILSQALVLSGLPRDLLVWVGTRGLSDAAVLAAIYLTYLVLGCFLGPVEMMLITLPFTYPLITGMGYDPVWFGIALVILIEVGLLTPPMGINLFVAMAIAKGSVSLTETAIAALPYVLLLGVVLVLISIFPAIVMYPLSLVS